MSLFASCLRSPIARLHCASPFIIFRSSPFTHRTSFVTFRPSLRRPLFITLRRRLSPIHFACRSSPFIRRSSLFDFRSSIFTLRIVALHSSPFPVVHRPSLDSFLVRSLIALRQHSLPLVHLTSLVALRLLPSNRHLSPVAFRSSPFRRPSLVAHCLLPLTFACHCHPSSSPIVFQPFARHALPFNCCNSLIRSPSPSSIVAFRPLLAIRHPSPINRCPYRISPFKHRPSFVALRSSPLALSPITRSSPFTIAFRPSVICPSTCWSLVAHRLSAFRLSTFSSLSPFARFRHLLLLVALHGTISRHLHSSPFANRSSFFIHRPFPAVTEPKTTGDSHFFSGEEN